MDILDKYPMDPSKTQEYIGTTLSLYMETRLNTCLY